MFGILPNLNKYLASGGGLIAFALSASQTTLLSFYVAHHSDASSLAVFGFLLSVHYFALQLLRRNVVEPYFQFEEIEKISQEKRQIVMVFLFVLLIFTLSILFSDLYELTLGMLSYSAVSIFWEMRKAALRVSNKIHVYTTFEFATVLLLVFILILNIFGLDLQNEIIIFGLAILHTIYLLLAKLPSKLESSKISFSHPHVKISTSSQGEFIYLSAIICSNAYLLYQDYSVELGEIRSVFLLLLASTFSVGALRNSLSKELRWSKVNIFLLLAYFGNIFILLLIPANILNNLIPSFPLNPGYLVLIISLDTLGSLIFLLLSLKLLKSRNMRTSANARLFSTFLLIIFFIFFLNERRTAIQISLFFAVSSLVGAAYLLLTIFFTRYKGMVRSIS